MGLIDELNLNPLQRLAMPIIERGVNSGLSGNKIQSYLRSNGMGIRRQTLQTIIRAFRNVSQSRKYVQSVRYDRMMNPDRIPISPYDYKEPYNYKIKITGIDRYTGEEIEQHVIVTSQNLLTKNEAIDAAIANIPVAENYGISQVNRYDVIDVFRGSSWAES